MNKTKTNILPTAAAPKVINDGENSQSNNSSSKSSSNKLIDDLYLSNLSIANNNNNNADEITIAVSNQSSDYVDESYDTLGLHWKDEPREGGVLSNATQSLGGVSDITSPEHYIPCAHIKIPLPIVDEDSLHSSNTNLGDSNGTIVPVVNQEIRKKHAEQNLKHGSKAIENSNFEIAADQFKEGILNLGPNYNWQSKEEDNQTALKLYSEGAFACYTTGDFDKMNELIDEVVKQDISIEEKFRCYEIRMLAYETLGENNSSLNLGIEVRKQLGFYTPPNKPVSNLSIIAGYLKANLLLGKKTPEELASLPTLTDERVIMAHKMLEMIGLDCFNCQPTLFPLIVFLNIKETLKYGIDPASPSLAFISYGILLCGVFGELQRGREMADASMLILSKAESMPTRKITSYHNFIAQGCIYHWTANLQETLAPLRKGYEDDIESGDILSAGVNQSFLVSQTYFCGRPLDEVNELLSSNVRSSCDVSQTQPSSSQYEIHAWNLVVGKLQGTELEEATTFDDILKTANELKSHFLRSYIYTVQLETTVIFSMWDTATELLVKAGDVRSVLVGICVGVRFSVLEALISIKTAQRSTTWWNRKKWSIKASGSVKQIRKWVKRGNVNLVHILHLLEAELANLNGYNTTAEENYQLAISTASTNGFRQDKALSHELASMYYGSKGDVSKRAYHMRHAIICYEEWGAHAKVDQLRSSGTKQDSSLSGTTDSSSLIRTVKSCT